jgi:hypothetical protein
MFGPLDVGISVGNPGVGMDDGTTVGVAELGSRVGAHVGAALGIMLGADDGAVVTRLGALVG